MHLSAQITLFIFRFVRKALLSFILHYSKLFYSSCMHANTPRMLPYSFNPRTEEAEAGGSLWLWDNLVYIMSFRLAECLGEIMSQNKTI